MIILEYLLRDPENHILQDKKNGKTGKASKESMNVNTGSINNIQNVLKRSVDTSDEGRETIQKLQDMLCIFEKKEQEYNDKELQ